MKKAPKTWAEFLEWAKVQQGGELCSCGEETCSVMVPAICPDCGDPLQIAIHVNAPTLIIGCVRCGRSGVYLKLERST